MIIKIGGCEYDIELVEEVDEGSDTIGSVLYLKEKIKIKEGMSMHRTNQTIVHELLHAIFYEAGFEEHEEDMINRVGIILHQVLRDNDFSWLDDSKRPFSEAFLSEISQKYKVEIDVGVEINPDKYILQLSLRGEEGNIEKVKTIIEHFKPVQLQIKYKEVKT